MMEELAANREVAVQPVRRRRHSKEFKAEVMRAAMQPHVSIAAVALHYRLNANLVRTWITRQTKHQGGKQPSRSTDVSSAEFVPLQLAASPSTAPVSGAIEVEVRRGATTITVRWPLSAASDCGAWLQGWLR
ncbi:transposase [Trinickia sp. Y13]|uniref:IS66-like element accessory protein TnpA n=1 Tax=Trinickia sp. Y13 TaxID=2917807 RepID=UPI002404E40C|nr:transposase [Trinickia sp. Y13]MDG0025975.1 transposase [Trinickia sp. Y13]